jgi:predicted nucleic acid-binding protein
VIVVDASVLIAYYNQDDVFNEQARLAIDRLEAGAWGHGLIPEYVFVETLHVLKRKTSVGDVIAVSHALRAITHSEFLPSSEVFADALAAFQRDLSTPLGFVDHAIAHTARQRAGGKILTFDRGFRGLPGLTIFPEQ